MPTPDFRWISCAWCLIPSSPCLLVRPVFGLHDRWCLVAGPGVLFFTSDDVWMAGAIEFVDQELQQFGVVIDDQQPKWAQQRGMLHPLLLTLDAIA